METIREIVAGRLVSQHTVNADGVPEGKFTSYWDNGQVREEKTFVGGRVDGVVRLFDRDGHLEEEQEYKDGLRHGAYRWHYKGRLMVEQTYKEGKLIVPKPVADAVCGDNLE